MILINTSRSARGFSRIGSFLRCPTLFALKEEARLRRMAVQWKLKEAERAGAALALVPSVDTALSDTAWENLEDPAGPEPDRSALIKGTLIGLGIGHWIAKLGAMQGGIVLPDAVAPAGKYGDRTTVPRAEPATLVTDPQVILHPEDAMELWCQLNPAGEDFLGVAVNCVRGYSARYIEDVERFRFLAVELEFRTDLGVLGGAVHGPGSASYGFQLDGHPEYGEMQFYTARIDYVASPASGGIVGPGAQVYFLDTKTAGRLTKKQAVYYSTHGQFTGHRVLGAEAFGPRFGNALLNLVETSGESFDRPPLDPSPGWTSAFKKRIFMAEHYRAWLEMQTMKGDLGIYEWPATLHELGCYHRYGPCEARSRCLWGGM